MKFYNSHGKYKHKLNEYFLMQLFQLNLAMFCATLHLVFLYLSNVLVGSVDFMCIFVSKRRCTIQLFLSPPKYVFTKAENSYQSIFDEYGVNADETCLNGDWFKTRKFGVIGDAGQEAERFSVGNPTRWIITQSKGFPRKSIEKDKQICTGVRLFSFDFSNSSKIKFSGKLKISSGCSTCI